MITASTLTNGTLTLVLDGGSEILTARNDHPKWTDIVEAFKAGNEAVLRSLISLKAVVESYSIGKLSINSTGVTHNGHPLTGIDSDRVLAFLRDGLPYRPIANYMERKLKNPSARAIKELYNFLEHKNMPLTPKGKIIAYKGVQSSFYSVMGNTKTVVLQGQTDSEGHILNTVGTTIEIERSSCDDDFRNGCSFGLHAGSLAYAKGWGQRVLLVEIDPADVVSVPDDCSCQKLRCCKYRVIGEYTGPLPDTYTSEFGTRDSQDPADDSGDDLCTCGGTDCPDCGCNCDSCRESSGEVPAVTSDDVLAAQGQAVNQDGKVVKECPKCSGFDCACDDSDNSIESQLKNRIAKVLDIDEDKIESTSTASDFGVDSLDEIEIIMAIEEVTGIEILDDEAESIKNYTFASLVEYVRAKTITTRPVLVGTTSANGNGDDSEAEYLEGMQAGIRDVQIKNQPHYLSGDETGADSPAHEAYIRGYLNGYFGSQAN